MAQVIHCDAPGCTESANVIMSNLQNGETKAFCAAHFNEFVIQYFQSLCEAQKAQEEAQKTEEVKSSALEENRREETSKRKAKANPVKEETRIQDAKTESALENSADSRPEES